MIAINEQANNEAIAIVAPDTINKNDLVSIKAMISYTANRVQAHEPFIERAVLTRFKISNLTKLPRSQREEAIHYLTDYRVAANSR